MSSRSAAPVYSYHGLSRLNSHHQNPIITAFCDINALVIHSYNHPALTRKRGIYGGIVTLFIIRCPNLIPNQLTTKEKNHVTF
ncbi:hypothetical protein Niako_6127 [Niastella koreensis GR20-10]|uniref:Uncharacterized protein n=1 Tax=Niastella koreensis (strain DSM 17620 / KACC 11465 / NBRC 106392 / GR20-10) TaxID=700598 RepID=G8T8Z5_NIAKG|nr:hypothetical protein Niako_6127 [Niastella koreensis GR20-10]